MAPKVPGKVDDISKTAGDVLKNDFQVKGYQLNAKQKTSFDDAVVTNTVDLFGKTPTAGKINFKFPKPFGIAGCAIDKVELAADGKFGMDFSMKKDLHGVKDLTLETKASGTSPDDVKIGFNYSGIPNAVVKFETKATAPDKFTFDGLYGVGPSVIGAAFAGPTFPTIGANFAKGDIFGSVIAKNSCSEFTLHGSYTIKPGFTVAKTYQHGGKNSGTWAIGASYKVDDTLTVRKKLESTMKASFAFKKEVVKGFSVNGGACYDINSKETSFGCKVSIE